MIPFVDLQAQRRRLGDRIERAMARVLEHGGFISGPEVAEFEGRLAAFCGAAHALGCSSGTDALVLPLMAWGIGPGDAVIVPAFTFVATAEAPALLGATPVFADAREGEFNLDPASAEAAIALARAKGLTPKAIIGVDLFGLPADYAALRALADREGLYLLADAAQGFGGERGGKAGTLGHATATSFFPAKPLGCYGDGGAVLTEDAALLAVMRSLRVHGHGTDKYDNVRLGLNARLDTLQAAILIEKLAIFAEELEARDRVAARYTELLQDVVAVPRLPAGARSAWAQFTLVTDRRDAVAAACKAAGVPTAVYYPIPLHRQTGYAHYPAVPCPVSERLAGQVISLPMHPYLSEADQDRVVAAVRQGLA